MGDLNEFRRKERLQVGDLNIAHEVEAGFLELVSRYLQAKFACLVLGFQSKAGKQRLDHIDLPPVDGLYRKGELLKRRTGYRDSGLFRELCKCIGPVELRQKVGSSLGDLFAGHRDVLESGLVGPVVRQSILDGCIFAKRLGQVVAESLPTSRGGNK